MHAEGSGVVSTGQITLGNLGYEAEVGIHNATCLLLCISTLQHLGFPAKFPRRGYWSIFMHQAVQGCFVSSRSLARRFGIHILVKEHLAAKIVQDLR